MSAPRTSAPQFGEDPQELQKKVVGFLYQMRIDAEVKCVVLSEGAALVDKAKEKVSPTPSPRPSSNPNPKP